MNTLLCLGVIAAAATCLYLNFGGSTISPNSKKWAKPVYEPLRSGDSSTQLQYIWNYGAPLGGQVPDRVSRRDYSNGGAIPEDLYEIPRSVLLHEFHEEHTFTLSFFLYQILLFLGGALILKVYVYPLFLE
jgi:hypothetical protein